MNPLQPSLRRLVALLFLTGCVGLVGCKSKAASKQPAAATTKTEKPDDKTDDTPDAAGLPPSEVETAKGDGDLVGLVSLKMIEDQWKGWNKLVAKAKPDAKAAHALAKVKPGAKLTIYFGAWCSDCARELPRLFKAMDIAGEVPFSYKLIGVDKYFQADEVSATPLDLPAVPLIVVERDGKEVGRIIEKSPNGIEKDLLSLLDGTKTGKISATH